MLFGSVRCTLSRREDGVIDSVGLPFLPGGFRPDHASDSLARLSTALGERRDAGGLAAPTMALLLHNEKHSIRLRMSERPSPGGAGGPVG